ncbi:XK-related protein 6-like [Montipora capricornis]|uniref:XK-related protein 6-like n=1 Tax=Montipora capricornis TaxID=246305 RepID=UPI0035F1B737
MDNVRVTIKVRWQDTLVLFVGTVLSFADPVTDILALVEFYRNGHKTWFGVGLFFVILPSLVFSFLYCHQFSRIHTGKLQLGALAEVLFCGCNPFSVALARLRGFILCLKNFKKLWCKERLDDASNSEIENLMFLATWGGMFEAVLESAPQFIIQLYAMNVQKQKVAVIQMISTVVSFLSLAWTFIIADQWRLLSLNSINVDIGLKAKITLYLSQLLLLGSRLLAITYFTVSFKWWIIMVLVTHSIFMAVTRCFVDVGDLKISLDCRCECCKNCLAAPVAHCFYWIRDDGAAGATVAENTKTLIKIQWVSNILFFIENIGMIFLYYFETELSQDWRLPITVCVCVFSFFGAVTRIALYRRLLDDQYLH